MNLVLLLDTDFIAPGRVRLTGRRLAHLTEIIQAKEGQSLTVGVVNGLVGEAIVTDLKDDAIELDVHVHRKPPKPLPLVLILALPRPNVLKRTLICAASLGIKQIIILNFNRVEQGLWNSSALRPESIEEHLMLGLEQAKDTIMPTLTIKDRFKPFVQDELPQFIKNTLPLVAHPEHSAAEISRDLKTPVTLVIGPEGGIIDYELDQLKRIGFKQWDLGPRILRVESAVPFAVGALFGAGGTHGMA